MSSIPPDVFNGLMIALALALTAFLEKIRRDLAANTKTTEEVKTATNGRLSAAEEAAAKLRQQLQASQARAEALADIVRYIQSRPEASPLLAAYADRRRVRVYDGGLEQLIAEAQAAPQEVTHAAPRA